MDFSVNGNYVTSGSLDSSGHTSVTFAPTPGTSTVTASYTGDSVFAGSSSNAGTFKTVAPYIPNFSTNVHYGAPNSTGAVKVKIKVTVMGVPVEPAPTGQRDGEQRLQLQLSFRGQWHPQLRFHVLRQGAERLLPVREYELPRKLGL